MSIGAARAILERYVTGPRIDKTTIEKALGSVLAKPIRADRDVPPFDRAAVDGFAIRLSEPWSGEGEFPVLGMVAAGSRWETTIPPGAAIQVMTGAPVPKGADGMVMVENSETLESGHVRLRGPFEAQVRPGLAPRGQDARKREVVLLPGTRIDPAHVAILAAVGAVEVPAYRRPRVDLIMTGDEIVEPDKIPGPAEIRNSNGPLLHAMLSSSGWTSEVRNKKARDTDAALRRVLARSEAEVLVFTGGVSMGEYDLVPKILKEAGFRIHIHRIAIRPGKPLLFGTSGRGASRRVVFGLPGNPVSVLVTAWEFLMPYLRSMSGCVDPSPIVREARLRRSIRYKPGLTHFVLGRTFEGPRGDEVEPVPYNGSGDYLAVGWADCLVVLDGEKAVADEGRQVRIHPLFCERTSTPPIPPEATRMQKLQIKK